MVLLAALLAVVAAAVEVVALFPSQGRGLLTMAHSGPELAIQVTVAAGFVAGAVALLVGQARGAAASRAGALLVLGVTLASVGLVIGNFANDLAATSGGFGLWLQAVALVVAGAAAAVGLAGTRTAAGWRPVGARSAPGGAFVLVGIVAAGVLGYALLPSWDRYVVYSSVAGRKVATIELGSVFATTTPTWVLVGTAIAAIVFFVLPVVAVRPGAGRLLGFAAGGAVIVVAAQAISAVVQMIGTRADSLYPASQVRSLGLTLDTSLTPWYDAEVVAAVVVLAVLVARWYAPDGDITGPSSGTASSDPDVSRFAPQGSTAWTGRPEVAATPGPTTGYPGDPAGMPPRPHLPPPGPGPQ